MRNIYPSRSPAVLAVMLAILLFSPVTGWAQYIGLEPERLVSLLTGDLGNAEELEDRLAEVEAELAVNPRPGLWRQKGEILAAQGDWHEAEKAFRRAAEAEPASRLGLAVTLFKLGNPKEALKEIATPAPTEDRRVQYARVLLKLDAEPEARFSKLRAELFQILSADPFYRDTFELWLALNPEEGELRNYLEALKSSQDPNARWQRAEVLLRLGEADRALVELRDFEPAESGPRNRVDRARAQAYFQTKADAAGQAVYRRLLERLDEATAELLFRDIGAIASAVERVEYSNLSVEQKADYFHRFWFRRHPAPAQDINPRLGEHYRRLARALNSYPLQSTGRGFFTDKEVFLSFSPELPFYDPKVVFESGAGSRYWLDPRGIMLLRHGEPDARVGPRGYGGSEPSESWLVSRHLSRPLLFNFVRRPAVGEWTLALNLAVAATTGATAPDDPARILQSLTPAYRPLYQSRSLLHPVYRAFLETGTADLERALRSESELVASFVKDAFEFDSTDFYTRENALPLAVSVSNFYEGGQPAIEVDFAANLEEINFQKLGPEASLEASLMVYDRLWKRERARVEKKFPLWPPPSGKSKVFVGRLLILGLDPEEYRLALQVYQPESGRIGIARGAHAVTYVRHGSLGQSDLFLSSVAGERGGDSDPSEREAAWLPMPARVIRRAAPARIDFELYNLRADESGQSRYEVEERLLTLFEKPGFFSRLAGWGQLAGQIFFPLYTFAGQVGGFALSQSLASETAGLRVQKRVVEKPAAPAIQEQLQFKLEDLKPGVYTVYVTVRDLVSGEISSRFLTLLID